MDIFGVYLISQNTNETWELKANEINWIGRSIMDGKSNIILPHPAVSKKHASITIDPKTQKWYFENISKNGSKINNQNIHQKFPLKHGDQITIESYTLMFYENFAANEETMETLMPKEAHNFLEETTFTEKVLFSILIILILFFCVYFIRNV